MSLYNGEKWRPITDWPLHEVSNKGRICVLPGAIVGRWNRVVRKAELLTTWINGNYVKVWRHGPVCVHTIVLTAWDRPRRKGEQCRHLNGDGTDNRWPENLAWGTPKENMADNVQHGKTARGDRHPLAKLSWQQVAAIRTATGPYGLVTKLSKQYGISISLVSKLRKSKYKIWEKDHVTL